MPFDLAQDRPVDGLNHSFLNWIQEKTGIDAASEVHSSRGLLVHVFGRLAAAIFLLNVLPQSA